VEEIVMKSSPRVHAIMTSRAARFILAVVVGVAVPPLYAAPQRPTITVRVTAASGILTGATTGRLFLVITHRTDVEPRLVLPSTYAYYFDDPATPYPAIFGVDVEQWRGDKPLVVGATVEGYPVVNLGALPAGDYSVQAVLNVYTKFTRSDGRVIWGHEDRGEGQQFHLAPGNPVSNPVRVHFDPKRGLSLALTLARTIPPIDPPADSPLVRHLRARSVRLSKFWGRDVWFGATVVLPKGYDQHPDLRYPLVIHQGHSLEGAPLYFDEKEQPEPPPEAGSVSHHVWEYAKAVHDAWLSDSLPRMIMVSLQHPTLWYDDSYFVDSPNQGPWQTVLLEEILPLLESRFRIIQKPYARVMFGGSTGGWISAALQIHRPDDFGGAWVFAPDMVDLRDFLNADLYADRQAFNAPGYEWRAPERYMSRSVTGQARMTVREFSRLSMVLGSHGRSGEFLDAWSAFAGPVGDDGYPKPVWNLRTGEIDPTVVAYWREHGFDLREYLERNWASIGPRVTDKLHFATGDMDQFFLNLPMYRMQEFLEHAQNPPFRGSIKFVRRTGHEFMGYDPWPRAMLEEMAAQIERNAPADEGPVRWRYR
jgi:hypothetical protein